MLGSVFLLSGCCVAYRLRAFCRIAFAMGHASPVVASCFVRFVSYLRAYARGQRFRFLALYSILPFAVFGTRTFNHGAHAMGVCHCFVVLLRMCAGGLIYVCNGIVGYLLYTRVFRSYSLFHLCLTCVFEFQCCKSYCAFCLHTYLHRMPFVPRMMSLCFY